MKTLFPLNISNTDLSLWSGCELKWFRERCQWLRKPSFNMDLTAGGAFAAGMAMTRTAFYRDKVPETEAIELGYDYILDTLHEAEYQDDLKSPERVALLLKDYFKQYPLGEVFVPIKLSDGAYAIEHKFAIELPINHPELGVPLVFKGKLDMLIEQMGRIYIYDDKTCKSFRKNEAELLATSGQFIGYTWIARKLGINVQGAIIVKSAIQKAGNKFGEFEIPITEYMVDLWETAMLDKVSKMVSRYREYIVKPDKRFADYFIPDFQAGCTSYFKPCPYMEGCSTKYGEKFIEASFDQVCWEPEERVEISLEGLRKKLGLDKS